MKKNLILLIADIVLFLVIVTSWRSQTAAQSKPSAGTNTARTEASAGTKASKPKAKETKASSETKAAEETQKQNADWMQIVEKPESETQASEETQADSQTQTTAQTEEFNWVPQSEQTSSAAQTEAFDWTPQSEQTRPQSQAGGKSAPSDTVLTGGRWEMLPSAEWTWKTADGRPVSDVWVSDSGSYYYIDVTGCMMKNNYASNGAWVGDDGTWDPSVPPLTEIAAPLAGERYGTDPFWTFDYQKNNNGSWTVTASKTYSFGHAEVYTMEHLTGGCYLLTDRNDPEVKAQLSVSADHQTIRISQAGSTEVCELAK